LRRIDQVLSHECLLGRTRRYFETPGRDDDHGSALVNGLYAIIGTFVRRIFSRRRRQIDDKAQTGLSAFNRQTLGG
jgi:hypothetical protein